MPTLASWVTWASSLTFMSTDFLVHKLEIIVGKSWSSTIIMVFYIITQLRRASFWKSASGLFLAPFGFLGSRPFVNVISTFSKEKSLLEAFCLESELWISKETFVPSLSWPKVLWNVGTRRWKHPDASSRVVFSEEKDMRGNPQRIM